MRPMRGFVLFFVLIGSAWGMAACQGEAHPAEIRLGVIAYLQGNYVEMSGWPTSNAAELAAQEINAAGGLEVNGRKYPVKLLIETIDHVPEQAVAAARKLINQENVVAIIGPQFSGDAIPVGEVAESAHLPMISPMSTNPKTTAEKRYVFRMSFVDNLQGKGMAMLAFQNLGARHAAVLYDIADAYSRGVAELFKQNFEAAGGQVVAFETYTTGEQDFTRQLERIRAAQVEVLVLPTYTSDARLQVGQIRQMGIQATLLGGDGWDQESLVNLPEFDGAFMASHWSKDWPDSRNQAFVAAYRQAFRLEPNDTAALTYDALYLLFEAIRQAGDFTPQAIRDELYVLGPFHGVSGEIDFQGTGDPVKPMLFVKFQDGKAVYYETFSWR